MKRIRLNSCLIILMFLVSCMPSECDSDWDVLSDDDVKGDAINIKTDNNAWSWEQKKAHTIDGFHFEAEAVIKAFMTGKEGYWAPSYRSAAEVASKDVYNRETETYDKN